MVKRSPIWEKYGKPSELNSDYQVLTCPYCEGKEFDGLQAWKYHMQAEHGGYTADEVTDSLPSMEGTESVNQPKVEKPKKITARARELNDKFNEALNLVIKHFLKGLDDTETKRLEELRGEVSTAVVGVEFDFEERLIKINSKIALAIAVSLLWVLPMIPSLKEVLDKAKEKEGAKDASQ